MGYDISAVYETLKFPFVALAHNQSELLELGAMVDPGIPRLIQAKVDHFVGHVLHQLLQPNGMELGDTNFFHAVVVAIVGVPVAVL